MEEVAEVYAASLFAVAREHGKLDEVREQLGAFADALAESHDLSVFFFSPYFSTEEKRDGLERVISGAEPELLNFLSLLISKHRIPIIARIRRRYDELWDAEHRMLDVTVTSAVELDDQILDRIREAVERQTDRTVSLESRVDDWIVGGLVVQVGNMVLDASIRNRLEKFRKQVATAA
jgi:F-type H+-transporting ATPase subunit delta